MANVTAEKKLVKSKSGYRMVPVDASLSSPFTASEPYWIPDEQCLKCTQCQGKFDMFRRRHHCRRCGKCFCNTCSDNLVHLPRMCFVDPVRQCPGCSQISKKEIDFFDKYLKILMAGGTFHVSDAGETTDDSPAFVCKLSSDHRFLMFEGYNSRKDNVLLQDVDSLQILTSGIDSEGNTVASGVAMKYRDSCGEMQIMKMLVSPGQNKKEGHSWVAAMQKAFKMIFDKRISTPS